MNTARKDGKYGVGIFKVANQMETSMSLVSKLEEVAPSFILQAALQAPS